MIAFKDTLCRLLVRLKVLLFKQYPMWAVVVPSCVFQQQ